MKSIQIIPWYSLFHLYLSVKNNIVCLFVHLRQHLTTVYFSLEVLCLLKFLLSHKQIIIEP